MPPKTLPSGAKLIAYDRIDSTSAEAKRLAAGGEAGPAWVVAASQDAGYGRRGRAWASAMGDLAATWFGPAPTSPGLLSFSAALAVAEALAPYVEEGGVRFKWPNDVLLDGAKAVGILLELFDGPTGRILSVGVGVNIVSRPALDYPTARVLDRLRRGVAPPQPLELLKSLDDAFARQRSLLEEEGFAPIKAAWLEHAIGLHGPIVVRLPTTTLEGTFQGLADDGALLLQGPDGDVKPIPAGDVYFEEKQQ
ncbi:MAG: biotin--[acetyl-CoA-carboxylase] ligase [Pseudomonadota bacterium]